MQRGPGERGSSPGSTVPATGSQRASPPGRDPESGGRPLQPHTGGGGGRVQVVQLLLPPRREGTKQRRSRFPAPPLPVSTKPKTASGKG